MQVLLLLVLTVALYFGAAFTGELLESRRVAHQMGQLNADIVRLQQQNTTLKTAVAEAKTDAFVERQARDKLGMVKAGDVPIIVANAPTPVPTPSATATPARPTHLQEWAALFQQGSPS